jgi:hypothetical protein
MNKIAIIALVVVIVVVALGVGYYLSLPQGINPDKFALFTVSGSPTEGVYTFKFALSDAAQTIGPADGSVRMTIKDSQGNILMTVTSAIKTSFFKKLTDPIIGDYVGYAQDISANSVVAGIPDALGNGVAEVTFTTTSGNTFSKTYSLVQIPSIPEVQITDINVTSDNPNMLYTAPLSLGRLFANQIINLTVGYVYVPPFTIYNLSILPASFTILSISPLLPASTQGSSLTVQFQLEIGLPDQAYNGPLEIHATTIPPAPQQGAMSIDTGNVMFNNPGSTITVYVRNTGAQSETLGSVYVDNVLQNGVGTTTITFNPANGVLAPGDVCTVTVVSTATNWADGSAHTIKVFATDGTPVAYSVHS